MPGARIVFFGTPDWAVPSLEELRASDLEVAAVVTNPDRASGRGMKMHPSPVKAAAEAGGIPVLQPPSAKSESFADTLRGLHPDAAAVVAYGKILPKSILDIPPHGFVNLHFSLLPEYRGAAPVQRAVMDGKATTGASTMLLTEGMDEGPMLSATEVGIEPGESAGELGRRLAALGAPLLASSLTGYLAGEIEPVPQDDSKATYAPKVSEEEARIDWQRPFRDLERFVRGLDPSPGAWTTLEGRRVRIFRLAATDSTQLAPGRVVGGKGLFVGCSGATATIEDVQIEGKRRMSGRDLVNGLRLSADARFE